ncbi:hypothetical protein VUJ49_16140 [Pseudomonas berkeleyensis]|uniref:Uncharacterized protein n=2 Tax=Pseudomonas TaxID=286 RepID=A0A7G5DIH6_9PSED|nr:MULTISPECIES: hypothetical protein [Pseudomonas]MBZ9667892.1 hypothetical protein [Pseudomonas chaetocerotis]QMV61551.1 hypothetical protein HS968_16065 [Pseudomonas berkeleyensis]WSO36983.1 hypothetical protein VUJ49_16140 [Pseudomonas berkeleyensis]
MLEETERLAWIDSQRKKRGELMEWLLRDYKMQLHLDEIDSVAKEIKKEKNNRTSFTNLNLDIKKKSLKEKEKAAWIAIEFEIKILTNKEFSKLKSRWSSYLNRKHSKSIGCSISHDSHEKLMELKGKHKLKDTIEVMISLIHCRQTEIISTNIIKPKTTPLLDHFKTLERVEIKPQPNASDIFLSAQNDTGLLQGIISKQAASIEMLLKQIDTLKRNRQNT